jgi:hypothetical protein
MTLGPLGRAVVLFAPALLGLSVVFVGFSLSPLWPAQDMPPELAARYARDFAISEPILKAGFALTLSGFVWMVAVLALTWRERAFLRHDKR